MKMKYPYCLPIVNSSKQKILETIEAKKTSFPFFEVWLDYVKDCDEDFVSQLSGQLKERLVVVFRRLELQAIKMPLGERKKLIDFLKNSAVKVDLDISSQQAELNYLRRSPGNLQTIISYHNYQKTPADKDLIDILQQIRKNNPAVIKIATYCQNESDAVRLLAVTQALKKSGQKHIVLGMGAHSRITRIFGPLWGNELVFAPETPRQATAPGQLTRKQLDKVLQIIGE